MPPISRQCFASSSKLLPLPRILKSKPFTRAMSLIPNNHSSPTPFFTPPQRWRPTEYSGKGKGKGKEPERPGHGEEEVDDREWEMRVARGMLHLRETLPHFFHPAEIGTELFPPTVFSQNVTLKLPPPLPLKISSLQAYSMAFTLARSGMQALHTDLRVDLSRLTISPGSPTTSAKRSSGLSVSTHRQRQVRLLLSAHGTPRLPPHKEVTWETSSLYTFSPYTGLINQHEVETIRPLPGEGVGEWLMTRLLGWTTRQGAGLSREGGIPCPSTSVVDPNEALGGVSVGRGDCGGRRLGQWSSLTMFRGRQG